MRRDELVRVFIEETEDLLTQLEAGLMELEHASDDGETINAVFRAIHSIKGGAGLIGEVALVDYAHVMENVLDRIRENELQVTPPLIQELLRGTDAVRAMVGQVSVGEHAQCTSKQAETLARIRRYMGIVASRSVAPQTQERASEGPTTYDISLSFRPDILETGQDVLLLIEDLHDLGTVDRIELDTHSLPAIGDIDPHRCYLSWRVRLTTNRPRAALDEVFLFVADENDIEISELDGKDFDVADRRLGEILVAEGYVSEDDVTEVLSQQQRVGDLLVAAGKVSAEVVENVAQRQERARAAKQSSAIRVDTKKLDELVDLVGEMVICIAQVGQTRLASSQDQDSREAAFEALDQIGRDLQEQVMRIRMVPVEGTFKRFQRMVYDLAVELGKKVKFETQGTDTELDKNVIEQVADPLKHLVRNAVHHGLETPAERRAVGKPETGTVHLSATQKDGSIWVEVSDDGRGIDRAKVLAKARSKGLVEEGVELDQRQVFDLLFEPGFSTTDEVNEISGRGVGLDVVKRNLAEIRGSVELESQPGRGATFRIRIPLTMAIIEGMNVQVGSETLTIPLLSVVEQIRPRREDLKTVEGRGELVNVRGEYLPLIRLHELFEYHTDHTDPSQALVIVLENDGRKYCTLVDDVLGQEQAVIKALDRNFRKVDGVAGATIRGDGRVSLIVDVNAVERLAFH